MHPQQLPHLSTNYKLWIQLNFSISQCAFNVFLLWHISMWTDHLRSGSQYPSAHTHTRRHLHRGRGSGHCRRARCASSAGITRLLTSVAPPMVSVRARVCVSCWWRRDRDPHTHTHTHTHTHKYNFSSKQPT